MRTMTGGGLALVLLGGVACGGGCGQASPAGVGHQVPGKPVEGRSPNAEWQEPAFPGQTRAPFKTAGVAFDVRVVARGLDRPWSIAFLPDGAMLVTEKPGRMRIVSKDGALSEPLAGVPTVDAEGQGASSTWSSARPLTMTEPSSFPSPSRAATPATARPLREPSSSARGSLAWRT